MTTKAGCGTRDDRLLADIQAAISAIRSHCERGSLSEGLVFDAVRMRLVEIGEATKGLSPAVTEREPSIPWREIARMRGHLAHRYFDTTHAIVAHTVEQDLVLLAAAVEKLRECSRQGGRVTG